MAARHSAGILLYRRVPELEVLLGRMGGPYWPVTRNRNWSIPKGEHTEQESPIAAARREFQEELGIAAPDTDYLDLGQLRQSGGKVVQIYAAEAELELSRFDPGTFSLEWPRGSGRMQEYPELAEVGWFPLAAARERLVAGQVAFLDRLIEQLSPADG